MTTTTQTKGKKSCVLDIATADVVSVPPTMTIIEGLSKMSKHNFRRLPLTDAGTKKLLGIVTVTDVIDLMGGGNRFNLVANKHKGNLLSVFNDEIRTIATENVDGLSPSATIHEAAEKLIETGHGSFPIVNDDNTLAGIVTEYDIMKVLASEKSEKMVCDVMTKDPQVVTPDVPLCKVTRLMVTHGFRRLPVVKDNFLIGIITATDIMKYLGGGKVFADMEQGKADEILMIPVREIMTAADIKTVTSATTLNEAAKMMIEYGIGVFPVLDGDELNGIVTEFDLVKALAE